jgi:iron complex outermembrane receptor protein
LLFRYEHAHRNDPTNSLMNAYVLNGKAACTSCSKPGAVITTKRGEISEDEPLSFVADSNAYQLTATLDAGFATITSYSQIRTDDSNQLYSLDLTSVAVASLMTVETNKVFTQELLLSSKPGTRLQWTTGAYYSDWNSQWPYVGRAPAGVVGPRSPYPQFLESGVKSRSIAIFGDATYEVVHNLFLTAGLRYTRDSLADAYSNFFAIGPKYPPTLTTSRLTPRGVIRYQVDNNASVYGSISKGYKSAIYNISSTATPEKPILPESIWAYEIGYKFANHNFSLNLSGYYYDYVNQQLAQSRIVNNVPQSSITNAASSRIYGIDADVRYQVDSHLSFNLGAAWNHARYKDFQGGPGFNEVTFANTVVNASGFHMTRAPDFTVNSGAAYSTALGGGALVLSGNAYYTSKFYFTLVEQVPQKAYATLDLRVQWTDPTDRYTLALAGKNVTDTHYLNQASQNALGIGAVWAAPATVEGSVRVKF